MTRFVKQQNGRYLDTASADNDTISAEELQRLIDDHTAAKAIASSVKDDSGKSNKDRTQEFIDDCEAAKE